MSKNVLPQMPIRPAAGADASVGVGALSAERSPKARGGAGADRALQPWQLHLIDALTIAICLAGALWPGDVQWSNDQPKLYMLAAAANAAHRLAVHSLLGTHGIRYGPVAVWIYQVFLLIALRAPMAHRIFLIVMMRAVTVRLGIALSLRWLGRTAGLWPWFVPTVMAAPYVWLSTRDLWDNSFCLPIGSLMLAAYASFLHRSLARDLAITLACGAALLLTHLMSLTLVGAIVVHMAIRARRAAARHWVAGGVTLLIATLLAIPYLVDLASTKASASPSTGGGLSALAADGFLFPLAAGKIFTISGLGYFFSGDWMAASPNLNVIIAAGDISLLAHPLFWLGIYCVVRRTAMGRSKSTRNSVAELLLWALGAQIVFDGLESVFGPPHYYNGAWAADAAILWFAVDMLWRWWAGRAVVAMYACALAAATTWLALRIHGTAGTREPGFGPTLSEQIAVADALNKYSTKSAITTTTEFFDDFHLGMEILRQLEPTPAGVLPEARLSIDYANDDQYDAHLKVTVKSVSEAKP